MRVLFYELIYFSFARRLIIFVRVSRVLENFIKSPSRYLYCITETTRVGTSIVREQKTIPQHRFLRTR